MIKSIIFDWGGVLAPPDARIAAAKLGEKYDFNQKKFANELILHENDHCHKKDSHEYDINFVFF